MEIIGVIIEIGSKILQRMTNRGMYEVLEYVSTLELEDTSGKHATFRKRQKVRYLQDNIIAFQDQAWGDGEILRGYRCSPGVPVDTYAIGHKTHILVSLREVKSRGDEVEFNIQWGIRGGFVAETGFWETEVDHSCRKMRMEVVFPKKRWPRSVTLTEVRRKRSKPLPPKQLKILPDGRWEVSWEIPSPRLNECYIIRWLW